MHLSQNGFYSKAYSVKLKVWSHYSAIDFARRGANYLARTAHPNIKLFIYQGGMQSTEEAFYYAVPIFGILTMSEQEIRIRRLVSLGTAIYINLNKSIKECLDTAIHQILDNKRYYVHIIHI